MNAPSTIFTTFKCSFMRIQHIQNYINLVDRHHSKPIQSSLLNNLVHLMRFIHTINIYVQQTNAFLVWLASAQLWPIANIHFYGIIAKVRHTRSSLYVYIVQQLYSVNRFPKWSLRTNRIVQQFQFKLIISFQSDDSSHI